MMTREDRLNEEIRALYESSNQLSDECDSYRKKATELERLIGSPPEGSHPDESKPRAETWHQERLNWIAETEQLRAEIARVNRVAMIAVQMQEDSEK